MRWIARSLTARILSVALSLTLALGPAFSVVRPAFAAGSDSPAVAPAPVSGETSPTVVRELTEKLSETATSYLLSDDTVKTVISETPVRFRDDGGAWKQVDTTLVPGDEFGQVESASTSMTASFGSEGLGEFPVALAGDGFSVGVDMLGVNEDAKLVTGDTVHYLTMGDGLILTYQVLADGIKETVVLPDAETPTSFEFSLALEGLQLCQAPSGDWAFYRPGQRDPVLMLGALTVFDSAGGADPSRNAECAEATMTVVGVDDKTATVRYELSPEWLKDPARVFPIMVDPTIKTPSTDTQAHEGFPTHSYGTIDYMCVGATSSQKLQSFVRFDVSTIPSSANIVSSTMKLYQSFIAGTDVSLSAGPAFSSFSDSTTWNTKPTSSAWWTIVCPSTVNQWVYVECTTLVREWISGVRTNYGMALTKNASGTNYRRLRTKEYSDSTKRPSLEVVWSAQPVTGLSSTQTASSSWFREVDRDSDGRADTPNDKRDQGRGTVNLTWSPSALAAGYNILMYDGSEYRKVGQTVGYGATSWSSAGAGIFPLDSEYTGMADNAWTANPYARAQSPALATRDSSVTVTDGGAGVVVSDGGYLYYRAWDGYPGPTQWKKVGSGLNGTTAGESKGFVGPDFASKPIRSAFVRDGFIYNGYALSPTTVEGVQTGASAGAGSTRTFTFSSALLDRTSGSALTAGNTNNVLLAASDEHVYSVAYDIPGGTTMDGFGVREYDRDGQFVASHDIAMKSYLTDGVISDGDNLYLIQWNGSYPGKVTKVSTKGSTWKVTGQWEAGWQATREISGCYDPANNVFWIGALDQGKIYRCSGPGLDLRDDPNMLYKKDNGTYYDATAHNYWFRVSPYSDIAPDLIPDYDNALVTPTLQNRTVRVNDDPRHTSHPLGTIIGHDAQAVLDEGALELDVTDLSIASWGPQAALTRHYSSATTSAVVFAPGWTFNFESRLVVAGDVADYFDETGERHRFTKDATSGVWAAPNGAYDSLAYSGGVWRITGKDRSVISFASDGRVASEADNNGNTVTYTWTAGNTHLSIRAANTQSIEATFTSGGLICTAEYLTPEGPRIAEFNYGNGYWDGNWWQIVRHFGDGDTVRCAEYDYGEYDAVTQRITRVCDMRFAAAGPYGANWDFTYDESTNKLSKVQWPGYKDYNGSNWEDSRRFSTIDYGSGTATITAIANVNGSADTAVEQAYVWNPTGTEAWRSDKRAVGTSGLEKWTSTYSAQNEEQSQTSPLGITTRSVFDSMGNAVYEIDGMGGVTSNIYDANSQLIRTTSPAGRTTYDTYDAAGNLTAEERVLDASGERSRTEHTYDAYGRQTVERSRIDANTWAETDYSDFASNGEAQTIIQKDVKLSPSSTATDLVSTKALDSDGKLVWEKNANGDYVSHSNLYDSHGALLSSTDASGVVTHHAYAFDSLGFESETSRTAGSSWADWKQIVHLPDGQVYEESYYGLVGGQPTIVRTDRHSFDTAGNETSVQTPDGTTAVKNDAEGQAISRVVPGVDAPALTTFDDDGNVTSETAPASTIPDTFEYDDNGDVTTETPAGAEATVHALDADGNEVATYEPLQGSGVATSTSEYDVGGRLVKSTDEKGFVTTIVYDQLDRQLTATSAGLSSTKTYNTLGWVLSETDPDGQVKTYEYDDAGRVVSETLSGKVTSRTYDATGRELSRALPDGSAISFVYDVIGRLASETHSEAGVPIKNFVHAYDVLGRSTATTETVAGVSTTREWAGDWPSGVSKRYGSLATTVTLAAGAETGLSMRATDSPVTATRSVSATDTAGRPITYTLDAGVSRSQTTTYSGAGKLTGQFGVGLGTVGITYGYSTETARQSSENIDLAYPGASADHNRTLGYDAAGRLTTATDTAGAAYSFTYSADGKITGNGARGFTYDTAGRLATMTVAGVATTYLYDSRGRRDSSSSTTEAVDYVYDDADHLTRLTRDAGKNGSVETSASYAYDANGQRTRSVVTSGSVTTTTTCTYDGLTLLSAASVAGSATTSVDYVNDSAGRPVAAYVSLPGTTTPVFVWIVTDQRGDVLELLDRNGDPLAYHAYTPYGEALSTGARAAGSVTATQAAGVRDAIELRFAGYTWDDESGLYYCSQRYYDPVTCQWITKDPARADGEESAYQYCGGDPVGRVDPSGEWLRPVHEGRTLDLAKKMFRYRRAVRIADKCADPDGDPLYAHGSKEAYQRFHGYKGSESTKKEYLDLAISEWKKGKSHHGTAEKYLGVAIHTTQDLYAHRRLWAKYRADEPDYTWLIQYDNKLATFYNPQHNWRNDRWKFAWPSTKALVDRKSKSLMKKFKTATGAK